jgi:hypothetical protein
MRRLPYAAKFVRHDDVALYLALGWCPSTALADTYHGQWAVLMLWLCSCTCPLPATHGA